MRLSRTLCATLSGLLLLSAPHLAFAQGKGPKPADAKPTDAKPADAKSGDAKPTDVKPGDDAKDAKKEAREHYQKALDFFDDEVYDAALTEFKKAYELSPSFRLLYNLGVTSERLKDYAKGLEFYDRFIKEGGADVSPEQARQVKDQIGLLRGRVSKVTFDVNVAGAEIYVDDVLVGKAPLDGVVVVNAGRRKFSAVYPEKAPWSRVIEMVGGEPSSVKIELRNAREIQVVKEEARPIPFVGLATTGVFVVGATVTGILAVGASKDYDDLKKTFPVSRQALDDQRSTVRTYSLIADVCIVGAIAAGGYSAYKLISWKPNEKKGEAPKTNAFIAPTPTGGMVGVGGVF